MSDCSNNPSKGLEISPFFVLLFITSNFSGREVISMITIQKRNGELAVFDKNKIYKAVEGANNEVREEDRAKPFVIETLPSQTGTRS